MSTATSIRLTKPGKDANEFLKTHPLPWVLNQEVSALIIRTALDRGWKPIEEQVK